MEVIKHGNDYLITTCDACGCIFGYTKKEAAKGIACPECGKEQSSGKRK